MTTQRTFKDGVRSRMRKTGESYTTARSHLLQKSNNRPKLTAQYPGLLPGYTSFGGVQGDTAVLRNVFTFSGVTNPATGKPYTEAMINGLCGGIGFMYALFEYKGHAPMLTLVMRSKSMPTRFVADVFGRVGVETKESVTGSARVARKALDDALAAGKPAICLVDSAGLPYYGLSPESMGMGPQYLAVVGIDDDCAWLDDRAVCPTRVTLDQLAKARGGYRAGKQQLVTIESVDSNHDLEASIRKAIGDTIAALEDGQVGVPDSFKVNCGFSGMEKWQNLLTDSKDKKSWPRVFAESENAFVGLRRTYACIQYEYTAPAAGRAFYADFLDEVGATTRITGLPAAAKLCRQSAIAWTNLAREIANCDDPAIRRACAITDERSELIDQHGGEAADAMAVLSSELASLGDECALTADEAIPLFAKLSERVEEILDLEREAVDRLRVAVNLA